MASSSCRGGQSRGRHQPPQTKMQALLRRRVPHLFRHVPKAWSGSLWCSGRSSLIQLAGTSSLQLPWHPHSPGKCHRLPLRTSQPSGYSASPETLNPLQLWNASPYPKEPSPPRNEKLYPGNNSTQATSTKAGMTEAGPPPPTMPYARERAKVPL